MKLKPMLFAACLLAEAPALAAGLFGGPPEPGKMPTRLVKFEALAVGLQFANGGFVTDYLGGITTRVARVTYVGGRFRVGAALFDGIPFGPEAMPEFHVGFNLLSRPKRMWFYGAAPDIYVEAVGGLPGWDFYGKLLACGEVDYYGVGASLETGLAVLRSIEGRYWKNISYFVGVRLRLLTFGIGF